MWSCLVDVKVQIILKSFYSDAPFPFYSPIEEDLGQITWKCVLWVITCDILLSSEYWNIFQTFPLLPYKNKSLLEKRWKVFWFLYLLVFEYNIHPHFVSHTNLSPAQRKSLAKLLVNENMPQPSCLLADTSHPSCWPPLVSAQGCLLKLPRPWRKSETRGDCKTVIP